MAFILPFELLLGFFAMSIGLALFGMIKEPKVPVALVVAGVLILTMTVSLSGVVMGKIPQASVTSGGTTTYTMIDNTYDLNENYQVKFLFVILAVFFIFMGAMMTRS